MSKLAILEELLDNLLKQVQDLLAVLVVDLDGLIIARQSIKRFDEELIGAIMAILEQTLRKIKRYAETSFGSGRFDINEFQLFYLELGSRTPAIFVLVANNYLNIEKFLPSVYIVAQKISSLLNNRETSIKIPKLSKDGKFIFNNGTFNENIVRIITIMGSETVGKSTLTEMYCRGIFNETYNPTIGITILEKELKISKEYNLKLYLLDLGGLKSFTKIRRYYYQYSNAVLILFDYSKLDTLAKIPEWFEESQHFLRNKTIPHILVGNKIDLAENREDIKIKAQNLAKQYNIPFFETSALTGQGIDELFTFLISNLF
ncbi:MAG: GTP-binding protein [Promethearchaeota archaeon]